MVQVAKDLTNIDLDSNGANTYKMKQIERQLERTRYKKFVEMEIVTDYILSFVLLYKFYYSLKYFIFDMKAKNLEKALQQR